MALKRILGSAVRHPLASTALVAGVAKGTLVVVQRLFRGDDPWAATDQVPATPATTGSVTEPARAAAEDRDLPEPVVIHADPDPEPTPDYTGHVDLEEELVWTSESSAPPASE